MAEVPYTLDEALELLAKMADRAQRDFLEAEETGKSEQAWYWEGWEDGLRMLQRHIRTGVKTGCFPVGACSCHPFVISPQGKRGL